MNYLNRILKAIRNKHIKSTRRQKLLLALSCVVVFVTVYALILPAVTMETKGQPSCGETEHTHTAACYEDDSKTPDCGREGHTHTLACYSPLQNIANMLNSNSSDTATYNESVYDTVKIKVTTQKSSIHTPTTGSAGEQLYYTGESATTTLEISNPTSSIADDGGVIRVYMQFDDTVPSTGNESAPGSPAMKPGQYTVTVPNGVTYFYTITQIEGTNTYCFEIQRPLNGDTISIDLVSGYNSPDSAGGTNTVWGVILSKEDKEKLDKDGKIGIAPVPGDKTNVQVLKWDTKPDSFELKKTQDVKYKIMSNGKGGAYLDSASYTISFNRVGDTLEGIGKDYVQTVNLSDVFTLPDGVSLTDEFTQALKDGKVKAEFVYSDSNKHSCFLKIGNTTFGRIDITPQSSSEKIVKIDSTVFSLTDDGKFKIDLKCTNPDTNKEINPFDFKIVFFEDRDVKIFEVRNPELGRTYTVQNDVDASVGYTWSDSKNLHSSCSDSVKIEESKLVLDKVLQDNNIDYIKFGSPYIYKITATNSGIMPYEKLAFLKDTLPDNIYMDSAEIYQLFKADTDHEITLTINNATFCKNPTGTITGMDGKTVSNVYTRNTSPDTDPDKYNGMKIRPDTTETVTDAKITLKLNKNGKVSIVTSTGVSTECDLTESAIKTALDRLGFIVVNKTSYSLSRDLTKDGKARSLDGGESISWDIPARVKDTFMLLENDVRNTYPLSSVDVYKNNVYAYGGKLSEDGTMVSGEKIGSTASRRSDGHDWYSSQFTPDREFELYKTASSDGTELGEGSAAPKDGSVITYSLSVNRRSEKSYDVLPLTDHMSGAQLLLAEADKNKDAAWTNGLEIFTDENGTRYYKLDKPGEYKGVWLNGKYADYVKVTNSDTGRDTVIKWYFTNLNGVNKNGYTYKTEKVEYKALVSPSKLCSGASEYYLNNESWLNDHETHRLYASVPGWKGVTFEFEKKIVKDASDKSEGSDYSSIKKGDTVYYRLMIKNVSEDATLTLTGKDIRDKLPLDYPFRWRKNSGTVAGDLWIEKYEGYTSLSNGDRWYVKQDENVPSQKYICWYNDFSVTIGSEPLYIYVRLNFAKYEADWQEYCKLYGSETLTNTFYVCGVPDSVSHNLMLPAKPYLQKGVFSTPMYMKNMLDYVQDPSEKDSLFYYTNDDSLYHAVMYYAVLYNDGLTRLYVQDMQDILPKGFTYATLYNGNINDRNLSKPEHSVTMYQYKQRNLAEIKNGNVTWKEVTVSASANSDNPQKITFSFAPGGNDSLSYDEERKLPYLNPGEGICFAYLCRTNNPEDTPDTAVNGITMPYFDYNNSGIDNCNVSFTKDPTYPYNTNYEPNDGGYSILDNGQASSNGFTGGTSDTQWLYSEVQQTRGSIKPGITKKLSQAISRNNSSLVVDNPLSANPTDILRWTITADNDGSVAINNYVLSDTMQAPYAFEGTVNYYTYYSQGSTRKHGVAQNSYLFKIGKLNDDKTVEITSNGSTSPVKLTINGDPVTVSVRWTVNGSTYTLPIKVQILQDGKSGNYTLRVYFEDMRMSIPAGGSGILTVDTQDNTGKLVNKVYINTAYITPLEQVWDGTTNKGNVTETDIQGESKMTVRNSAPVTTSYGYTTSALKSVYQTDDPTNKADCNSNPNYIVLPDKSKEFTYTLQVDNSDARQGSSQSYAMTKLVIIDGLPEINDHSCFQTDDPRNSEFKVSLASNLNFKVTVTKADGSVTTLTSDQYVLEFSTKTEFSKEDWAGTSAWSTDRTGARSIRVKINDPTGTMIPAKSVVRVSFNARVDGDAQPGQIAWNSFGYHYGILGNSSELEAAPLEVGVMIPTVPTIQKRLQKESGETYKAEKDQTFRFIIYTGESITSLPYRWTEDDLAEALTANGRKATLVELTVKKGQSTSDKLSLKSMKVYEYTNGKWVATTEDWTWSNLDKYTVVELPTGNPYTSDYIFNSINNNRSNKGYTFTYTLDNQIVLNVLNDRRAWSFKIRKVDAETGENLPGAMFALYSTDANERMSDEEYQILYAQLKAQGINLMDKMYGDQTWYLVRVATTDENGIINWNNLSATNYAYLEIKAPSGYENAGVFYIVNKDNAYGDTFSVKNKKKTYALPETGGTGTTVFYAAGGILVLLAAILLIVRKRMRRKK